MRQDDDILLGAYLDGELPAGEADALTERLAREPALMQRLEALRAGDAAAKRVFGELDAQPLPAAVLELLAADAPARDSAPKSAEMKSAEIVSFPPRGVHRFLQLPVALAASVALVAGFLVSNVLREQAPGLGVELDKTGLVAAQSDLHEFLETETSGEPEALADGAEAELLFTFEDRAGDWCRQLRLANAEATLHGVACRRDGQWRMEAMSFSGAGAPAGAFVPAGSAAPPAMEAAVDALIGTADPLDAEEEKRLISEVWRTADD